MDVHPNSRTSLQELLVKYIRLQLKHILTRGSLHSRIWKSLVWDDLHKPGCFAWSALNKNMYNQKNNPIIFFPSRVHHSKPNLTIQTTINPINLNLNLTLTLSTFLGFKPNRFRVSFRVRFRFWLSGVLCWAKIFLAHFSGLFPRCYFTSVFLHLKKF